MTKEFYYQNLAYDYEGQALLLRCKASVLLENEMDEWFWDVIIQRHHPAKYNYIYNSRSSSGQTTSGCTHCLHFRNYLSKRLFICIDSDFRYLGREAGLDAHHYICQTYAYSWENHYCFAEGLQERLTRRGVVGMQMFDFNAFLQTYSKVIYVPLLLFLYMKKERIGGFSEKQFAQALSLQYRSGDLKDNGMAVIERLEKVFSAFVPKLEEQVHLNIEQLKGEYEDLGLTEESAYLHVRGHNLYALVKSIGVHLVPDFEYEVLLKELPNSTDYRELSDVVADLNIILSEE